MKKGGVINMTVEELISKLKEVDPNLELFILENYDNLTEAYMVKDVFGVTQSDQGSFDGFYIVMHK